MVCVLCVFATEKERTSAILSECVSVPFCDSYNGLHIWHSFCILLSRPHLDNTNFQEFGQNDLVTLLFDEFVPWLII